MLRPSASFVAVLGVVTACGATHRRNEGALGAAPPVSGAAPAAGAVDGFRPVPAVVDASQADASPPPDAATPSPPPPVLLAASCSRDADCGWDDPCAPSACGAKAGGKRATCAKPRAPGACRCAAETCALVRADADDTQSVACKTNAECAFDPSHGVCVAAAAGQRPAQDGIACDCDTVSHRCEQTWHGPVTCRSYRDCSSSHLGGGDTTPAPSWLFPRYPAQLVRPCRDAERDSVCVDGECRIESWRC